MAHALGIDRAELVANGERALEPNEIEAIDALGERRLKHEPVARIFGRKEFWNLDQHISPAVLVPRPETETVVEAALDAVVGDALQLEKLRILDIGTGSGALLLALLSELPNTTGIGTDISTAALDIARANAERNDLAGRCTFIVCDIAAGLQGTFDLIVSNPPYVARGDIASLAPEVRDYDPALALDGGADGLDGYRAIAADARARTPICCSPPDSARPGWDNRARNGANNSSARSSGWITPPIASTTADLPAPFGPAGLSPHRPESRAKPRGRRCGCRERR